MTYFPIGFLYVGGAEGGGGVVSLIVLQKQQQVDSIKSNKYRHTIPDCDP